MARSVKPSTTVKTLCMGRARFDHILLQKFSKRVIFEPFRQWFRFQTPEMRCTLHTLHHNDLLRVELIEQGRRLCRNDQLSSLRGFFDQLCEHFQGVGMQAKFRFIDDDCRWWLGLQKGGGKADE